MRCLGTHLLGRRGPPSPHDVFNAGGVPSSTYVGRDHLQVETRMGDALLRRHAFTIVSGPTKCGKSVLCHRMLGPDRHVTVEGGQVPSADAFWLNLSHELGIPTTVQATRMRSFSLRGLAELAGGIPGVAQKKFSMDATAGGQDTEAATYSTMPTLAALRKLRRRDVTLVIEDFHYIAPATQRSIVRALKPAVFAGLRVILLAVPHRAFDPADVESEVEGRVNYVEVPGWSEDDLLAIADKGFRTLGMRIPPAITRRACADAFGNPLIMQEICREIAIGRTPDAPESRPPEIELASAYDRLVDNKGLRRYERMAQCVVPHGPPLVALRDGGEEATAMVFLGAIARNGPAPVSSYAEIRDSFAALSRDAPPSPEEMGALCAAMGDTISIGGRSPLEWLSATREVALTDPFLMFYMRWILRDRRALALEKSATDTAVSVLPGGMRDDGTIGK